MVLEATVVILDNSEWMRNGDFIPSRLDAQLDAAHLICNAKRQANVENSIAVITMGGSSPQVLVTLTSEQGKLQHAVASAKLQGHPSCNLLSALQVAQLVLKNRQNSNQRQRIVVFLGSPLDLTDANALGTVGKMLKKNGVALDIITMTEQGNAEAVSELLAATAGLDREAARRNILEALLAPNCTCHFLPVQAGDNISEALMSSPILVGEDGAVPMGGFGMDDDMDPELAMALKLSLEEENARQQRTASGNGTKGEEEKTATAAATATATTDTMDVDAPSPADMDLGEEDEDAMLARAIAMSMETASQEQKQSKE